MTTLREAAQQALEAWDQPHGINYIDFRPYMDALRAALAEPVQEPVAWMQTENFVDADNLWAERISFNQEGNGTPLYTAPQRKPLTDEEISKVASPFYGVQGFRVEAFARAVEQAHGIKEET